MRCELCQKPEQCSCRGGGCPICRSTRSQIQVMNDLLKFGIDKATIQSKLTEIHSYTNKIDSYTLYEYINGDIDKTKLDEAVAEYKPTSTVVEKPKPIPFKTSENEGNMCVYNEGGPWARCIHCGNYRRYFEKRGCPMAKSNLNNNEEKNEL